jgi:hypothetical protein
MRGPLRVDIYQTAALREALAADPGCEVTPLSSGDYAWTSDHGLTIGVESKTANDLVSSLSGGRLPDQVVRLVTEYDVPVLFIVGAVYGDAQATYSESGLERAAPGPDLPFPYYSFPRRSLIRIRYPLDMLSNFLLTVQHAGVFIDHVCGDGDRTSIEANRIRHLIAYWDKPAHASLTRKKLIVCDPAKESVGLSVLRALPGINDVLAQRLLEAYGTPGAVLIADEASLAKVKGIGKARAKAIWDAVWTKEEKANG